MKENKMINTKQTKITWNQIKEENNLESISCGDFERILITKHGFKRIKLVGQIGHSGTKTHNFFCVAKFHPATPVKIYDGKDHRAYYEIATCFSYCGSKKWQSSLLILDDSEKITCKKCCPKSKALQIPEGMLGSN
jgi:hypothetical protein